MVYRDTAVSAPTQTTVSRSGRTNPPPREPIFFTPALSYPHKMSGVMRTMARTGLLAGRQMYWWRSPGHVNFGDWIGPLIFQWRTGRRPILRNMMLRTVGGRQGAFFLCAGSTLDFPAQPNRAIVWGAGFMWPDRPFARPREVRAVRGPLSRKRYVDHGVKCPNVLGDPGILLPHVLDLPPTPKKHRLGIVPNWMEVDAMRDYALASMVPDVLVIDPQRDIWHVCADILACEYVVSSSLHGLITAHAFGIPAGWVTLGRLDDLGTFKYLDYYAAFGIDATGLVRDLPRDARLEDAVAIALNAPAPDVARLSDPLLAACPF